MLYKIRAIRCGMGIQQKVLANQVGISAQYLNKIEKGKANPTKEVMVKIADALGYTVNELFFAE